MPELLAHALLGEGIGFVPGDGLSRTVIDIGVFRAVILRGTRNPDRRPGGLELSLDALTVIQRAAFSLAVPVAMAGASPKQYVQEAGVVGVLTPIPARNFIELRRVQRLVGESFLHLAGLRFFHDAFLPILLISPNTNPISSASCPRPSSRAGRRLPVCTGSLRPGNPGIDFDYKLL